MTPEDGMNEAIGQAIVGVVNELERGVVTRWVAVVESIGPEGRRGLWLAASEECKTWDVLGMLHFGIAEEQSALTADRLQGGGDD